jgi:plasmid replication initiation protein
MLSKCPKALILRKPNQCIMISNGKISGTQRKAYNVLLLNALYALRQNGDQQDFYIALHEIKEKAGIDATDNVKLKSDLKKLMTTTIEIVRDKNDWDVFVLISSVRKEKKMLHYELPTPIRHELLHNEYYSTIDLMVLKTLNCKYSIILYEIIIRYRNINIPTFTIEEFKKLMGCETYNNFGNIIIKVLAPAVTELNEKTEFHVRYELMRERKRVIAIKFIVEEKKGELLDVESERLRTIIRKEFGLSKDATDQILNTVDHADIAATIELIRWQVCEGRIKKSLPGFAAMALQKKWKKTPNKPALERIQTILETKLPSEPPINSFSPLEELQLKNPEQYKSIWNEAAGIIPEKKLGRNTLIKFKMLEIMKN